LTNGTSGTFSVIESKALLVEKDGPKVYLRFRGHRECRGLLSILSGFCSGLTGIGDNARYKT